MPVDKKSGKKIIRKTGRCVGRHPVQFPDKWEEYYKKWKSKEISAVAAMEALELKTNSFYKLLHKYEFGIQ